MNPQKIVGTMNYSPNVPDVSFFSQQQVSAKVHEGLHDWQRRSFGAVCSLSKVGEILWGNNITSVILGFI